MSKKPMTEERFAEIRARAEAATPGPWVDRLRDFEGVDGYGLESHPTVEANGKTVCIFYEREIDDENDDADAAFIAAAREDVPALLAEVERLRAKNARQEEVIWFFSEAVKDFARYEVKLGTPKEYKTEIGGEYPVANRETWNEPYWRKAADMATRENKGNSGDVPESEQEGKR